MKKGKSKIYPVLENITILDFAAEGKCVAKVDDIVIFVEGAVAPGDIADLRIIKSKQNFKEAILNTKEGDTVLTLKQLTPVRLIKNKFYLEVETAEKNCASKEELEKLLGRGRAKKGMFEGNLTEGELEIGQISASIDEIKTAAQVVNEIMTDFQTTINQLKSLVL